MATHINDFDTEAELDRARRNGEPIARTHRNHAVPHQFGDDGEHEHEHADDEQAADETEDLREQVAEQFGLDPAGFEGVDRDTLATIVRAEHEHAADRSPSADMRGRGGSGDGSPADSGDETREREHSAEPGRGSNGYPAKGRSNWEKRGGDRPPSERIEETRREHAEHAESDGRGANGYPKKGREAWAARDGRTATEREHSDDNTGEVEKRRRRFERFAAHDPSGR
jgi:hypothetical protein